MSGTNDYQLYAGSSGANVITQAQYLALTSIINNGMSSGIVPSNQMNKILRQLSMASAALGQIIANNNVNAVDDGNVANFVSQLLAALNVELAVPTFATNAEAQALISTTKTISPATLAAALQGGNQSLSANGYQKLPGGLILQWGTVSESTSSTDYRSFPISFPNVCASCNITLNDSTTGGMTSNNSTVISITDKTKFLWNAAGTYGGGGYAYFIALGW